MLNFNDLEMKKTILLTLTLVFAASFSSCEKEKNEPVIAERIFLLATGAGIDAYTGSNTPELYELRALVTSFISDLNEKYKLTPQYTVVEGVGETEEQAKLNAKKIVEDRFNEIKNNVIADMNAFLPTFNAARKQKAEAIKGMNGYYLKMQLSFFLYEDTLVEYILIHQTEEIALEAIGGTDYSE
jgi:hypothetical protein